MKRKQKTVVEPTAAEWEQASLERFKPLISEDEYASLVGELQKPLLPSFRINPLKMSADDVQLLARRYNWKIEPIPFCRTGYHIEEAAPAVSLSQTLEHRMGHYYIQEAASMIPVELFHMESDQPELCLDLAASPGGKTTHLISRGGDHSLVIANDSSAGRIPALQIVLQTWGAANQMITQFPGEKYGMWFPETFDRVLIDAPCSMQGLRTAESHDVRPVTGKEVSALSKRQVNLLTSALQAVKVGGEVAYSTCTLMPEEDEAVIDQILSRFSPQVEILETGIYAPGILSDGTHEYNKQVGKSLRLWPDRLHTAGFFACLLRKNAPLALPSQPPPSRPLERTGFAELSRTEERKLKQTLLEAYGFDLESVLEKYDLITVGYHDRRFAFPAALFSRFADLPVQSAGLPIGDETAEGFIPSHAWVSRFIELFPMGRTVLQSEYIEDWLHLKDVFSPDFHNSPFIRLMMDSDGRYLGRGRMLDGRVRNLLPHHSR